MSESDWQALIDDPLGFDPEGFDPEGFDPDELREFLAADLMDDPADPAFREQLRKLLWEMVRKRYGGES